MGTPTHHEEADVQFMMLMYPQIDESDWNPPPEAFKAMMAYNQELGDAGVLIALNGLQPPSNGSRVAFSADGKANVTDGPFAEAKEMVGGYWIIDVRSKEEAVEWARRCPGRDCVVEVRGMHQLEDFPAEVRALIEEQPLGLQ
jgi:hypothetical protein